MTRLVETPEEKRRSTAYHEAGHAVVADALGFAVGSISIRPGPDGTEGWTEVWWLEEERDRSPQRRLGRAAVAMAGREAEQLVSTLDPSLFVGPAGRDGDVAQEVLFGSGFSVKDASARARDLLSQLEVRKRVDNLAVLLLERDTLDASEFEAFLHSAADSPDSASDWNATAVTNPGMLQLASSAAPADQDVAGSGPLSQTG